MFRVRLKWREQYEYWLATLAELAAAHRHGDPFQFRRLQPHEKREFLVRDPPTYLLGTVDCRSLVEFVWKESWRELQVQSG